MLKHSDQPHRPSSKKKNKKKRRGSKSIEIIPKRAMATATSLRGRERANEGIGSGGGTRKQRAWKKNFIVTITQHQSRAGWKTQHRNFIITIYKRGGRSMSRRLSGGWDM
jgi:hypothetical protein